MKRPKQKNVIIPVSSEHETEMAVDIVAESNKMLIDSHANIAEQQRLFELCAEYGFVLRYHGDE